MYSLISIKVFSFSLVVVEKSNIDDEKEIIDNREIMELDMKPSSMILKIKNKGKTIVKLSEIQDNDEIVIKNKTYIVLHKIKY
jgi:hypothetical protein